MSERKTVMCASDTEFAEAVNDGVAKGRENARMRVIENERVQFDLPSDGELMADVRRAYTNYLRAKLEEDKRRERFKAAREFLMKTGELFVAVFIATAICHLLFVL